MCLIQALYQNSIAICLITWAWAATAEDTVPKYGPYDYYSTHSSRPWFAQFESWYPHNAKYLVNISTGICNQTLRDYRIEFAASRNSVKATKLLSICYRHEACIVDQLDMNHLLNYQSALVTLGLVPTLLVFVGPGVAELSLLYLHRPILSAMLSLGTPTIWTGSNIFEAYTPDRVRMTLIDALVPRRLSPRAAAALSAGEYLLAAGAAANSIFTALEVGRKTILAWGCTTQFAPFFWAALPSLVYAVAGAKNYYVATTKETTEYMPGSSYRNDDNSTTLHQRKRLFAAIRRLLSRETTICANREKGQIRLRSKARKVHIISNSLDLGIGIVGVIHFAFGIAVFSSLQFVTVLDAFRRILSFFALSTLICRAIVLVELAGLNNNNKTGVVELNQELISNSNPNSSSRSELSSHHHHFSSFRRNSNSS